MNITPQFVGDTHIRIDTTEGNGKHAEESCARQNNKTDQIAQGKNDGEETCLDSTPNKSVQNRICVLETSSRTGENHHQCNWRLWISTVMLCTL